VATSTFKETTFGYNEKAVYQYQLRGASHVRIDFDLI
jgi:hypothetical protein